MRDFFRKYFDIYFLRFLLVGVINTVAGMGVDVFCLFILHFSEEISYIANCTTGALLSFFLNKSITFNNRESMWKTLLRFIGLMVVCTALSYGVAKPLVMWALAGRDPNLQKIVSAAVGMAVFGLIDYFGMRLFVFGINRKDRKS